MPCTPFVSPIAADKALPSPLAFQYNLCFPKPGAGCWAVGHVAAPAGFPGFSLPWQPWHLQPNSGQGDALCSVGREPVWEAPPKHSLSHFSERYVAVTVKSSVCFVGLNCKCFEGRAWLLCMHVWVCIFIQFIM